MHLHQPRKKLCLNDITYFSNTNVSPFSYTQKRKSITPTNKGRITTPHTPKGMMKETIAKKIKQYKQIDNKQMYSSIENLRKDEMRTSPLINKRSKELYNKVAKERNLSPNVLERFANYQKEKSIKKIKMKIVSYHNETQRLPRPQEIKETGAQMGTIKEFLEILKRSQQKHLH